LVSCVQQLLTVLAETTNAVKDKAIPRVVRVIHRSSRRSLTVFVAEATVSRMSYRQQQSAHARARLITRDNNRKAGRTIIKRILSEVSPRVANVEAVELRRQRWAARRTPWKELYWTKPRSVLWGLNGRSPQRYAVRLKHEVIASVGRQGEGRVRGHDASKIAPAPIKLRWIVQSSAVRGSLKIAEHLGA
jgi:hypothetical protein